MLGAIQRFFEANIEKPAHARSGSAAEHEHAYQLATAALLIEMTQADRSVQPVERDAVSAAIRRAFDLSPAETDELVRLAELEAKEATSLYEFTSLINAHFKPEEKHRIVEHLWHVAFADGAIDKYEEHLVRQVAELIHVPHREFIQAKLRVKALHTETKEALTPREDG